MSLGDVFRSLPVSWTLENLGRSIESMTDGPFGSNLASQHYTDSGARVIRLGNIGLGEFKDTDRAYISIERYSRLSKHAVQEGDLIVAGLGDDNNPLGRACIVPDGLGPAIVKADCFRVRVNQRRYDSRYIVYLLRSEIGKYLAQQRSRGSTRRRMNLRDVAALQIPRPPLEEQRRIGDFLDFETARMSALSERRVRMCELLKLRRELVLESALNLSFGADGGQFVPLKYLAREISVGIVITPAKWYVDQGGVPALRGLNVQPGRISTDDLVQLSTEGNAVNRKSILRQGDLVVVRTGQAGAAAVIPAELDGVNCIDLVIVRPGPKLNSRYVEYVLNSGHAKRRIAEHSVGSIQAHFNVSAMKQMPIPRISLGEQQCKVEDLDARLSVTDRLLDELDRQEAVLAERRQALITEAVLGRIDVTTTRGVQV